MPWELVRCKISGPLQTWIRIIISGVLLWCKGLRIHGCYCNLLGLLLWHGFDLWPRNFLMPWVQSQKKKKKSARCPGDHVLNTVESLRSTTMESRDFSQRELWFASQCVASLCCVPRDINLSGRKSSKKSWLWHQKLPLTVTVVWAIASSLCLQFLSVVWGLWYLLTNVSCRLRYVKHHHLA